MPGGAATDPDKDAALILDGRTGKVLYARNELAERHPASLTKMMTLYLLFEALRAGKLTMQTQMPVSVHASEQKPTKLYLRPGQTINVETAIRAIVIRSANDVAVVIAEALGGTESHFAEMMTEKARAIGMRETNYHNASGLPDPLQITTATDLSVLARHLAYDFPQYFPYFGTAGFTYKGVYYPTHDNLIGRYQGADGVKTGFTGASGFNLTSSVVRGGVHLVGIVMGGRTAVRRDIEMMHLLDLAFAQIAANPGLVSHGPVPWQSPADFTTVAPQPVLAGLAPQSGNVAGNTSQFAGLSAPPAGADEDSAERHRAPDETYTTIHAEAPQLAGAAPSPPPAAVPVSGAPAATNATTGPAPAIRPLARPDHSPEPPEAVVASAWTPAIRPAARPQDVAAGSKVALAAPSPAAAPPAAPLSPKPGFMPAPRSPVTVAANVAKPILRPDVGEGDVDQPGTQVPGRNWTIQIGAYADQGLAKSQLEAYALRAKDVVGQAARIIAPYQASDGHTFYRARFGLFAEREARQVCDRLTQRGQTCFAAVAAR